MKKYLSLFKASMSEGMSLFKIKSKNKSGISKMILPIFLAFVLMLVMYSYNEALMEELHKLNAEYVLLTLFIILTSILTLVEGIYKSGNLLFNCKDDNLLLSLPISKNTVLFIRVLKFYLFELLYNSLFIIPTIINYAVYTNPDRIYYIISIIGLFIFPIIPILISCIIGSIITFISSKFKGKRMAQTVITIGLVLGLMYFSSNMQNIMTKIAQNSESVNDFISNLYYPAGAFVKLVLDFNIIELLKFIGIHIILFIIIIFLIGRFYFKVNSGIKTIRTSKTKKEYKIKASSQMKALIKKELNRFINSPVFVINAGFGLILFLIGTISLVVKYDVASQALVDNIPGLTLDFINNNLIIVVFAFIAFSSFMTSITSSMISLEGKTFNILKSLPVKPYRIIQAKVLAAVLIMIPCILIGDIIVFVKFKFDLLSIILLLIASLLLPLLNETIGIIVNLKYPRMDAQNDTEVVKQSMSSLISVFIGMFLTGFTIYILYKLLNIGLSSSTILASMVGGFGILYLIVIIFLNKTATKSFNNINV